MLHYKLEHVIAHRDRDGLRKVMNHHRIVKQIFKKVFIPERNITKHKSCIFKHYWNKKKQEMR